ncbi:hypothetical protein BHF68_10480 [Desulfuribacillus alkaliarsenatis]|uniref:Helicase SNF2 n=1 Tax=Desulfuribacillus alkaliarsenatis TaxID=766136 RepID=A0A1E5FZG4_9FIRM|nr:hypothetical protein BHF68_10480 [Desulfuribacillus alkaliarsenatis]
MELTEESIRNRCVAESTFKKGLKYYADRAVKDIAELLPGKLFHSIVAGGHDYHQRFEFNRHGVLMRSSCDCPAFSSFPGHCKHIVAALFAIKDHVENVVITDKVEAEQVRLLIEQYQEQESNRKEPLQLELTFHFEASFRSKQDVNSYLSLKVGTNRLYVVTGLEQFLEAVYKQREHTFTKLFTYSPWEHYFSDKDEQIVKILLDIYEYEQMSLREGYYSRNVFQGKRVFLPKGYVMRLFNILQGSVVNAEVNGVPYQGVPVFKADLPIQFALSEADDGLELSLKKHGEIEQLFNDGNIFLYQHTFYLVSAKQQHQLQPVLTSLRKLQADKIRIPKTQAQPFVSGVLRKLKQGANVEVSPSIEQRLIQTPLRAQVYLDYEHGVISCDLKYRYGDIVIDPFTETIKNNTAASSEDIDRILIRDTEQEQRVMDYFEQLDFQYNGKTMFIEDEGAIYQFLASQIAELQQFAEIYYSERFNNLHRTKKPKFSGKIAVNASINVLEVQFELEGVERTELLSILNAIKEKRTYYRLKDGAFISLAAEDIEEVAEMARLTDELQLRKSDWAEETIQLPLHQALLFDDIDNNSSIWRKDKHFQELVGKIKHPQEINVPLPAHLEQIMRPYQKTGYQWLHTLAYYGFGGILADDMGLGKTLQAISYILSLKTTAAEKRPALVLAPTSLVYNWQSELASYASELSVVVISGAQEERQLLLERIETVDVVITSYPLVRRDIDAYRQIEFSTCILDEAQFLKNHTTITAQAVKTIRASSYFALTGTPIENSVTDLWSIFDIVLPGFFPSIKQFQRLYGEGTLDKLHRRIKPFILRRVKKDVLQELPDKIENKLISALTIDQKKLYMAYLEQIKGQITDIIKQEGFNKGQIKILAALTRLRQICCHPGLFIEDYQGESGKLLQLQEILTDMIAAGHRILIFSQFASMLKLIRDTIDQTEYSYHYLDGSTPAIERMDMANRFNQGEGDVFLISLKAGGTGLNLTGADTVILYDLWWNPAVEDQATDRAHRIGQEKVVQVIRLIAQGTIEEKIYELQQKKRDLIGQVIQSGETMLSKLSEAELKELLSIK